MSDESEIFDDEIKPETTDETDPDQGERPFIRPRILLTSTIRHHNAYTSALDGEYREFAFNEERGPLQKGQWRQQVFKVSDETPMDLEIGTGNGLHFQYHASTKPQRCLLGVELKYKPLIQTIRGAVQKGATNARIVRYHAFNLDLLVADQELDDVYIHFPDPWTSPRKPQNRILNNRMLDLFFSVQRPGSKLDFKTDSREAYLWSMENIRHSKYEIEFETMDLHQTEMAKDNIITQFERIFLKQGTPINFVRLRKPLVK